MTETVVISAFPQQLLHCQRVAAKSYTSETQPINWLLLVQITVTHFTAINQSVAQCFLPGSELVCLLFWVGPIYLYCVYQNIGFCDAISWANIWQAIKAGGRGRNSPGTQTYTGGKCWAAGAGRAAGSTGSSSGCSVPGNSISHRCSRPG